ncbi:Ras-related protein Rab-3 like protein [Argiope bruennichi]|uniref:Ras-related protein Rab-3 like protein n=1 Tax=Argiope bruennichi TaxID=94029 RepID=A0A8T0E6H3_ARGBR|nr:Ras-related protein Rab-3 like protein [Argiope bruennichi]
MTDSVVGETLRRAVAEEIDDVAVSFKMPRRRTPTLITLKKEVDIRKETVFIEAICGIVGQPSSGRKYLGDRFGRMKEEVIEEISEVKLCYSSNFDTVVQGRLAQAHVKAYIIPPPYYVKKKVPLYVRASHQFCCLLFAFDVTNPASFDAARDCIKNMKISLPEHYFLIGNKCDLRGTVPKENEVKQEFARKQAILLGARGYFECSAKRNINVKSIMEAIVQCECDRPHV